jgi:hypothetical protein
MIIVTIRNNRGFVSVDLPLVAKEKASGAFCSPFYFQHPYLKRQNTLDGNRSHSKPVRITCFEVPTADHFTLCSDLFIHKLIQCIGGAFLLPGFRTSVLHGRLNGVTGHLRPHFRGYPGLT